MAQQDIKVSVVGDTLPVGGAKINANFAEVRAELVIAEAAATTAANVAAQASADAAAATSAVATATSDAAAAVAAVAAATAASDAAVAAVAAATANNAVTDAKLRDSAGVSVIGRSANSSGDPADIAAGSNDTLLRRVSDAVDFGQLTVGMVPNDLITYAKLQNVSAASRILGRLTSGAGDVEELTGTQLTTLLDSVTSSLKGLAPASGGGTSTYLRADGIWSAPTTSPAFVATAAETTAAVTITDNSKLSSPGLDLRRYGVDFTDSAAAATNNTAVLNALGAAGWTEDVTFYWPPGKCRINNTITFSNIHISHNFDNRSEIHYYGTADRIAFVQGNSSTSLGSKVPLGGAGIYLVNHTSNPYTDEGFIGLQSLGTVQTSTLHIRRVEGFTIGWQIRPSTSGFAYNEVHLGQLIDNKYNIDIHSFGALEFVNENLFLGGSFRCSAMSNSIDSYGVVFRHESGGYSGHNRNIFLKPSFELSNAAGATNRTAVLYSNNGVRNEFRNCRVEGGRQYVVDIVSTTVAVTGNLFEGAVLSGTFTAWQRHSDGGAATQNTYVDIPDGREAHTPYYDSGNLLKKAFNTDTAKISVKGCFFQATGSSTATYTGTGKIFKDYVVLTSGSNALGVEIDTTYYKSFLTRRSFRSGFGGRVRVVCYDSAGAVWDSGGAGHPYATSGLTGLSGAATYGYSYGGGADSTSGILAFTVNSDVAKIRLLFTGGTAALHLKNFVIWGYPEADNPQPLRVTSGLSQSDEDWYVNGNPSTILGGGFVAKGQRVGNSAVAAGGATQYVCTAEGWLAKAWVASTAYLLGEMVNNDTGKTYECLTAGTSAGSGGPTGTATSGITDNTCTWGYIGTQATWRADLAGQATAAQGDLLYASATDTLAALAKNTSATRYLANTGTSNNPAWAQVALATGVSGVLPAVNLGVVTAPTDSTHTDNWNPTNLSTAREIRWAGTASTGFSGLVAQTDGTEIVITNGTTDYLLWLENQNTNSTAANRFMLPKGFPAFLMPGDLITLRYDGTASRWRVLNWANQGSAMGLTEFTDCLGGLNGPFTSTVAGTGATIAASSFGVDSTEKAAGVTLLTMGTATTGRSTLGTTSGSSLVPAQGAGLSVARVATSTASDGTETYSFLAGFHDASGGTLTDAIAWEYRWNGSAVEWSQTVADNTAITRSVSGSPTPDTTTFFWVVVYMNPGWTRADFIYSQDSMVFTKASSVSSGLPATTHYPSWGVTALKSAGTTSRSGIVDLAGYRFDSARG